MKKFIIFVIILLILLHTTFLHLQNKTTTQSSIQKSIATKIIRFHVIGNSNSSLDQNVKLEIKNNILDYLKPLLDNSNDINYSRKLIQTNLKQISHIAQKTLSKYNLNYSVNTNLTTSFFPKKQYGDMTLPAGKYEAVRIKLGNAYGKNWWCVLYPSLCFVDSTYSVLPSKSKNKLKQNLTSNEYNYIMQQNNTSIKFESFIFNSLKKLLPF